MVIFAGIVHARSVLSVQISTIKNCIMKRVFVFQDFKSQKFWSIEVVGTDVTVNYGKLGTDGQTQVKNYATTEEAEKAASKLIAEKTKKGYVETAEETAREMKVEAKKYTLSYDVFVNNVYLLDKFVIDILLSKSSKPSRVIVYGVVLFTTIAPFLPAVDEYDENNYIFGINE